MILAKPSFVTSSGGAHLFASLWAGTEPQGIFIAYGVFVAEAGETYFKDSFFGMNHPGNPLSAVGAISERAAILGSPDGCDQ